MKVVEDLKTSLEVVTKTETESKTKTKADSKSQIKFQMLLSLSISQCKYHAALLHLYHHSLLRLIIHLQEIINSPPEHYMLHQTIVQAYLAYMEKFTHSQICQQQDLLLKGGLQYIILVSLQHLC